MKSQCYHHKTTCLQTRACECRNQDSASFAQRKHKRYVCIYVCMYVCVCVCVCVCVTFIDVDLRDTHLASMLSSSNNYESCFIIIELPHNLDHPLLYFNHTSLDCIDHFISTILVLCYNNFVLCEASSI